MYINAGPLFIYALRMSDTKQCITAYSSKDSEVYCVINFYR